MKITAVIYNQNGGEYLGKCLSSLMGSELGEHKLEIIVVDDNSSDNSEKIVQSWPGVHLISKKGEVGFISGVNEGLSLAVSARPDYVWLVGSDVEVAPSCLIYLLVCAGKFKDAGIVSPKIYDSKNRNRFWYAGGIMNWFDLASSNRGEGLIDSAQYEHDIETDFTVFACMLIKRRVLDDIGFLDPAFFESFTHNDFCQRVRRRSWRLMYASAAHAWYSHSYQSDLSNSLKEYYFTRNRLLFGLRHGPLFAKLVALKRSFNLYFSGRPWQRRAVLDFYSGNFGTGSVQK